MAKGTNDRWSYPAFYFMGSGSFGFTSAGGSSVRSTQESSSLSSSWGRFMLLPHHSCHTMLLPDDGLPHYLSVAPFFMLRREKISPSYQKDVRRASGVTVVTSSPVFGCALCI